jgi:hypothetical protein
VIKAEELDRVFDQGGEDVDQYFDVENVSYPGREPRSIAINLPAQVFDALEREAGLTGTPVHELVETWVQERA